MQQRTHLKFREQGDNGPTDLCSTIEGLLDLPQGHRLKLQILGNAISTPSGFYKVYSKPYDILSIANNQEPIYERYYSLKYVNEKEE